MTNDQIREAVKRMAYIKSLQEEKMKLRDKVIREMRKRRKDKINLGGPNKEDYVCLRESEVFDVDPEEFKKKVTKNVFYQCIRVVKNRALDFFTQPDIDGMSQLKVGERQWLTYKVSFDENNQVRGIDL